MFQELQQLSSCYYTMFLQCYVCDVERYTKYRKQTGSRGVSNTKNIQCPHWHFGLFTPQKTICTQRQQTKMRLSNYWNERPLTTGLIFSVSTSPIISASKNPSFSIWCAINGKRTWEELVNNQKTVVCIEISCLFTSLLLYWNTNKTLE